jgi:hypothetical protein
MTSSIPRWARSRHTAIRFLYWPIVESLHIEVRRGLPGNADTLQAVLEEGLAPQPYRIGFKGIIDIAFDAIGKPYVLQQLSGPSP